MRSISSALKNTFPWRVASAMLVGYLLATVPQVILDPLLSSHVAYHHPRHYPLALLIAPIAVVVFLSTLIVCAAARPNRFVSAILPFLAACLGSIPIFAPEMPHGNLTVVCVIWLSLGSIAVWVHDTSVADPTTRIPPPGVQAQIEYIKEQTAIWKACTLGLVAVYLGMIVTLMHELHMYNTTFVTAPKELFLLNRYVDVEMALMSLFMFAGPIYEAAIKVSTANQLFLLIQDKP